MYIQVLGSAAGGRFPQWNCNCVNCKGYRDGTLRATARTQSSIALSDDGVHWVLCNASPDIRAQLQAFAPMQPARALRDTGINAIVLLDSQIDHTTGLLSLREGCPHQVWCTDMVHQDLTTGFPLFNMLSHWNGGLQWNRIELEGSFVIEACPNLKFTPSPCAALHRRTRRTVSTRTQATTWACWSRTLVPAASCSTPQAWARSTASCWR